MGSDPPVEGPAPDAPWKSLEPLSLLINLLPNLWRTARQSWPLFLAMLFGGSSQMGINLFLILLFFGLSVARTVAHFMSLRYRYAPGRLELQEGILNRRHRVIDPSRIQNVEVVQNLFHRAFGLAELRMETAGGEREAEGLLSAISVPEANALRGALARKRQHTGEMPDKVQEQIEAVETMGWLELLAYGVSAGRVGAAMVVLGVLMEGFTAWSPAAAVESLPPRTLLGLSLLAMVAAFLFSSVGAVLRYSGFRLTRGAEGLATEAGLLTRRRVEIPTRRVQLVHVSEPWLRRLLGYGTIQIETAAAAIPGIESGQGESAVPMVAMERLSEVSALVLPSLDVDPWTERLRPAAPRALLRGMLASGLRWTFIGATVTWWTGNLWFLLLPFVGPLRAALDWRVQGWLLTPRILVARTGFPTRHTWILDRRRLQRVAFAQGPLQRWYGLGTLEVWVAGSQVRLPDLHIGEVEAIFEALSTERRTPARG